MPNRKSVDAFINLVVSGAHDTAIERYYAPSASMQENVDPPRKGQDALVAREQAMLASIRSVETQCVRPVFVDGDKVVIRWIFRFTMPDGALRTLDELAYQRWEGDKIAEERFYYDPKQMAG